jgi:hypothetical protein
MGATLGAPQNGRSTLPWHRGDAGDAMATPPHSSTGVGAGPPHPQQTTTEEESGVLGGSTGDAGREAGARRRRPGSCNGGRDATMLTLL